MSNTTKSPVMLYTEQTPNPESLKFVTNKMLFNGIADFQKEELAQEWSPAATALFELPYVKGVYINNNYITITKELTFSWQDIVNHLRDFIKDYVGEGNEIIKEGFLEAMQTLEVERGASYDISEEDIEIVNKIKELIDTYVRPAVEMDGGNIAFKSYRDGIVGVVLQGSCSGCPSSTVTLKAGIESMLKRMIPQVKEVVAEAG